MYECEYDLLLKPDVNTSKHTQWYYFSVKNMRRGERYKFNIINMMKRKSLYTEGMRPLAYSQRDAELHGVGWVRKGDDVCYYPNRIPMIQRKKRKTHQTLTFSYDAEHDGDTVYFAHCFPYTYSDLQAYLTRLEAHPERGQYVRRRILCHTLCGNACDLLTITSFSADVSAMKARRGIVISARVHPGEVGGVEPV